MGLGKAFLFSILALVGINFIFTIIYFAFVSGFPTLFTNIQNAPLMIIYYLFGALISFPHIIFEWTIAQPFFGTLDLAHLIFGIAYLVALIIPAILAGKFGESKAQCFGGWLLTAFVSTVIIIIGIFLSNSFRNELNLVYGWASTIDVLLINILISCTINIFFYGFFAVLVSKIEYY
ncbi:MAG: hypothetical protein ACFFDF_05180 [Candidatus Odinarchaeota archaeon]